jgi:hypothetical protein
MISGVIFSYSDVFDRQVTKEELIAFVRRLPTVCEHYSHLFPLSLA